MLIDPAILRKLFPYLNFAAIGLGMIKLMFYYSAFGVNIIQYLDFSESLILCFESIIHLFLFLIVIFISSVLFLHKIGDFNSGNSDNIISNQNFWKRLAAYFGHNIWLIGVCIFLSWLLNPYFLLVIPLLYLLSETRYVLKHRYNTDLNSTYHNLILWGIFFVAFEYSFLLREVNATKYYARYEGTILTIDTQKEEESRIVSDSVILFVGKTKEFYYMYDKKKGSALIIPSDKVLEVDLKNKYRWFGEYPK